MNGYWERCWKDEDRAELYRYLDAYYGLQNREMELFKEHGAVSVCDAACGFGAYTLAFASNGFDVQGFDISETAVEITRDGLKRFGVENVMLKTANILDTGYEDESFDGVVAHAILDHLTTDQASAALKELLRIIRTNGLLMLSFDNAEEDDFSDDYITLQDGTMQYINGPRKGMLFSPFDWERIDEFLDGLEVVYQSENRREKTVILKK